MTQSSADVDPFECWRSSLSKLTKSADQARAWRERRSSFAYRLGEVLTGPAGSRPALMGPALYGVFLPWGLLYVGLTLNAQRRLRDLPVGESHHLANTYPPEIWDRVVVVSWAQLPQSTQLVGQFGEDQVGLGLEHLIQVWAHPLANSARRTSAGGWVPVVRENSASRGARVANQLGELADTVKDLWLRALDPQTHVEALPQVVRFVTPKTLL
jgi:hypothetical protein